jgi:hypothetical protein
MSVYNDDHTDHHTKSQIPTSNGPLVTTVKPKGK